MDFLGGLVVCDGSTSIYRNLAREEEGVCGTLVNKMMMEAKYQKKNPRVAYRASTAESRDERIFSN